MARRKSNAPATDLNNLLTKSSRKRKALGNEFLLKIDPATETQKKFFEAYDEGKHLVAHGVSGTGKTFISLYKALQEVLDEHSDKETVYIVRSLVQTRPIGYMPGDATMKESYYETPYRNMVKYMFQLPSEPDFDMLYDNLKSQKTIKFYSTSFLRGLTFDNCIVIVEEFENLNFHELDSIITRVGENCRIIFSGDAEQSDLIATNERNGIHDFMRILQIMPSFELCEFDVADIVRSGLVKEYILSKRELKL
jgi:phosphate starvation-inducible protein PhoH